MTPNEIFALVGSITIAIPIIYLALHSMGYFHKKPAKKG